MDLDLRGVERTHKFDEADLASPGHIVPGLAADLPNVAGRMGHDQVRATRADVKSQA
jgi:3,4-dihydroxy-2-butanone 4-phosphate synthase